MYALQEVSRLQFCGFFLTPVFCKNFLSFEWKQKLRIPKFKIELYFNKYFKITVFFF